MKRIEAGLTLLLIGLSPLCVGLLVAFIADRH